MGLGSRVDLSGTKKKEVKNQAIKEHINKSHINVKEEIFHEAEIIFYLKNNNLELYFNASFLLTENVVFFCFLQMYKCTSINDFHEEHWKASHITFKV